MKTEQKILKAVQSWQDGSITLADLRRVVLPYCHWDKLVSGICPASTRIEILMAVACSK
jgi:hypothetical protein